MFIRPNSRNDDAAVTAIIEGAIAEAKKAAYDAVIERLSLVLSTMEEHSDKLDGLRAAAKLAEPPSALPIEALLSSVKQAAYSGGAEGVFKTIADALAAHPAAS